MGESPEAHYDRLKAMHADQQALELSDSPAAVRGPWIAVCGDPGPYAIRRPTPKNPGRLEVLRCTSPAGHGTPFHRYAEADRGVLAGWTRDGRPVWPKVLTTVEAALANRAATEDKET